MELQKEVKDEVIEIKFQMLYREACTALPIGFSRHLPLTVSLGEKITVFLNIEYDNESELENLLIVTTCIKSISPEEFDLLENPIPPCEPESVDFSAIPLLGAIDDKLAAFAETLQRELDLLSSKTAHLIGWRHKIFGFPHQLEGSIVHLRWGLPNEELRIPPFLNNQFPTGIMKLPHVEIWNQTLSLTNFKNSEAPLYFELLNEAVLAQKTSPKSSLVMFITALETAIKQYIAIAAPQAEWLIREIQSPPIAKLYGTYLEHLPSLNMHTTRCIAVPKDIKKKIEHFVKKRNEIVHGKEVTLDIDTLNEIRELAIQLIYYIDWLRGEDWALDFIHGDLQARLVSTLNRTSN